MCLFWAFNPSITLLPCQKLTWRSISLHSQNTKVCSAFFKAQIKPSLNPLWAVLYSCVYHGVSDLFACQGQNIDKYKKINCCQQRMLHNKITTNTVLADTVFTIHRYYFKGPISCKFKFVDVHGFIHMSEQSRTASRCLQTCFGVGVFGYLPVGVLWGAVYSGWTINHKFNFSL